MQRKQHPEVYDAAQGAKDRRGGAACRGSGRPALFEESPRKNEGKEERRDFQRD